MQNTLTTSKNAKHNNVAQINYVFWDAYEEQEGQNNLLLVMVHTVPWVSDHYYSANSDEAGD